MNASLSRLLPVMAGFGLLLAPSAALAQTGTARATAVQLFDEADKLMAQGRIAEACTKYAASNQLDPQLGALLHLADCQAKNGQLASAWSSFRDAQDIAQTRGDERANFAKEQANALEPRLSRLTLVVSEAAKVPGLEIRIDGAAWDPHGWGTASPVDAGSHAVEARAPGYESWSSKVEVKGERQSLRVEVPALEKASGSAAAEPASTAPASAESFAAPADRPSGGEGGTGLKIAGVVGIAAGAAGLGLGVYFISQRNSTLEVRNGLCPNLECPDEPTQSRFHSLTSEATNDNTIARVGFIGGGVLVAAGVTMLILGFSSSGSADAATAPRTAWVAPAISPQGFALAGGARF